jgi:beta-lactam-binding protein with PASTA domain
VDFPVPGGNVSQYFRTPTTDVPSVVGLSEGSALNELRSAKLGASVVDVPSLAPAGQVLAQSPGAGATVPQGTAVLIEVSTGQPPSGVVPGVFGLSFEEALGVLQSFSEQNRLDLVFQRSERPVVRDERVGLVLGTDPGGGVEVGYGATVTIVVGIARGDGEG